MQDLWIHLEELRRRILFCLGILFLLSVVCYFQSDSLLSFLLKPLESASQKAYFFSPYDAFLVKLKITFWSAFLLVIPLFLTEAWLFVAPGLYAKEKKIFLISLISSLALFLSGVWISIKIVIPTTIHFFLGFSSADLAPLISIEKYLGLVIWMSASFGLAFVTPVVLVGLVKLRVLSVKNLKSARRYVVVGIFILAAIITPTPDPLSQCLLAIPLIVLFEASIWIARLIR